jgi:lipopolysaccharide transport system ATP-binding protein
VAFDDGFGLDDVHVTASSINGVQHATVAYDERVEIALQVRLNQALEHPVLIFDILDIKGLQLSGRRIPLPRVDMTREIPVRVSFAATIQRGVYRIRTRIAESPSPNETTVLSRQEGTISFDVAESSRHLFTGLFPLPMEIDVAP